MRRAGHRRYCDPPGVPGQCTDTLAKPLYQIAARLVVKPQPGELDVVVRTRGLPAWRTQRVAEDSARLGTERNKRGFTEAGCGAVRYEARKHYRLTAADCAGAIFDCIPCRGSSASRCGNRPVCLGVVATVRSIWQSMWK